MFFPFSPTFAMDYINQLASALPSIPTISLNCPPPENYHASLHFFQVRIFAPLARRKGSRSRRNIVYAEIFMVSRKQQYRKGHGD